MLLQSSSTPILNSWIPPHTSCSFPDSCTDRFINLSYNPIPRPRALPLTTSSKSNPSFSPDYQADPQTPPLSTRSARRKNQIATSHLPVPHPPRTPNHNLPARHGIINSKFSHGQQITTSLERLLTSSSSGLGAAVAEETDRRLRGDTSSSLRTLVEGGGDGEGINGRIGGDWGRSDAQDGSDYSDGSGNCGGHESTDVYYQRMIEANPCNALLLGNYAKFLKEVRGDIAKAEEYCERAILASQGDGSVLSLYADIIWETQGDARRAETYFDQAVKSSPNDCYVLASYARFLWDSEEE